MFSLSFWVLILAIFAILGKGTARKKGKGKQRALELATEHINALTNCDVEKLVDLRDPDDFVLYLPIEDPRNVNLEAAEQGWNDYCGALAGTTWEIEYDRELKDGVIIGWKISGPLIEPYVGHDVFFAKRNKIVAQVTTFRFADLVFVSGP